MVGGFPFKVGIGQLNGIDSRVLAIVRTAAIKAERSEIGCVNGWDGMAERISPSTVRTAASGPETKEKRSSRNVNEDSRPSARWEIPFSSR